MIATNKTKCNCLSRTNSSQKLTTKCTAWKKKEVPETQRKTESEGKREIEKRRERERENEKYVWVCVCRGDDISFQFQTLCQSTYQCTGGHKIGSRHREVKKRKREKENRIFQLHGTGSRNQGLTIHQVKGWKEKTLIVSGEMKETMFALNEIKSTARVMQFFFKERYR